MKFDMDSKEVKCFWYKCLACGCVLEEGEQHDHKC